MKTNALKCFATEYIWHSIKQDKTVGIIHEDSHEEIIEIAEPVGVVAGVTPVTNPTSTTMFKALIAIKQEIQLFSHFILPHKNVLWQRRKQYMMQR